MISNNRLNLYAVFHLNLAYSSIEEEQRPEVIQKCYWPLLKIARKYDIPLGIEASGYTLEIIKTIDASWIAELRGLITEGICEFIGSGYAQIIGPLAPSTVNDWNQKLGLIVYEEFLGIRPKIALINEMAYSGGIVGHYVDNGYSAIIMEWNNPRKYHPEWKNEWKYFPQLAVGADNKSIPLIWADSIAFQKFQRYAHGEYDIEEYMKYIKSHEAGKDRFFPLYANDAEIFDFRPGRYGTEAQLSTDGEWRRINELFSVLSDHKGIRLVKPSDILKALDYSDAGYGVRLESSEQPIPVKKQEKYNITRWALTGRGDLSINTECFSIYDMLKRSGTENPGDWKELCYLWSSDFRTHITQKRWDELQDKLKIMKSKLTAYSEIKINNSPANIAMPYIKGGIKAVESEQYLTVETGYLLLVLNKRKGLTIKRCVFKELSNEPLLCTLEHGYYDDISLGADFFSGHSTIERPGKHKTTDLKEVKPEVFMLDGNLIIKSETKVDGVVFRLEIVIPKDGNIPEFTIHKTIICPKREIGIIHPMHFTFYPEVWDKESLYFQTHNGGAMETFGLGKTKIEHSSILSALISSRHGLGTTEGLLIVGDGEKALFFNHNLNSSALIPSITYIPFDGRHCFLRLQYSAQEVDETFAANDTPCTISSSIVVRC
jgi:hypothetical protein